MRVAERVTVLRDGRKVGTLPVAEVDQRRIAHLMTGLDIEHAIVARDMSFAVALLVVEGLSRRGEYDDVCSTCTGARCSASSACSAPAAPSSRSRFSA